VSFPPILDISALRLSGVLLSVKMPPDQQAWTCLGCRAMLGDMVAKKDSEKPKVIEYLYKMVETGEQKAIVSSADIKRAIDATKAKLSTSNPANFLKDIIRTDNANANWPEYLKAKRITARQRYGLTRVFQFIPYQEGQTEPFPSTIFPAAGIPEYRAQSASLPFTARRLGRREETWLTQVVVNLRLIETQLSVFSPMKDRLRDVTHLQMGMKTQPEIDAVFLSSFGKDNSSESPTTLHLLITCEAKQLGERILEDQIKEQVAKAMEETQKIKTPAIDGIKPMAVKVVEHKFKTGTERGIYVIEFASVMRDEFDKNWKPSGEDEERLYRMTLKRDSDAVYQVMPPVRGLNN
jgi:hypothetical protein